MTHTLTIGPSSAVIIDGDGRKSALPKVRSATFRVRCACGWRGPERTTPRQAMSDGAAHVKLMEPETERSDHARL